MDRVLKSARSSGSLNLSNRSLRELPNEVYQNLDGVGEDEKWWEAVELQKLILAHNNLKVLKEDIRNLSMLTVLNVSHNKLSCLPAAIGELALLKSLDVSFNSITSIPEEIGAATSLVKLDCSKNLLKELPCSLGKCLNLSELKASNNCISKLPDELVSCTKLIKFDVEGNKLIMLSENMLVSWTMLTELNAARNLLTSIPDSIGALSQLIRLDFHQNKISSIPPSIMGCSSLAEFYMGTNLLSSLPAEIGSLSRLGTLDLHSNQLKEYPVEACKLQLSVLDLSNNSLSGLPPEIGTMTTLRKLLLTGNPLRSLRSSLVSGPTPALLKYLRSRLSSNEEESTTTPTKDDEIGMATRLSLSSKELNLNGLGLTCVPPAVWETDEVVKVDLSRNSIEELPNELSTCSSIQVLVLSRNKIKEWPGAVLFSLPNLSCLKLDNNPLAPIPSTGLEAITKLAILDLSCNTSSLPEPSILSSLSQLQELYLRRMQLAQFPLGLLCLRQLRILNLSQNSIVSIPQEIKELTYLTELDLSDNNIAALPSELGLLEPSLQVLKLDGNPLRSIRRTILDRGTKAILKYLKDKLPDQ
ncbi:plant intracellular Ras-group-related LRR protein 6 isoform X1 [Elaeis guineensis]|uniref:Plant intracellular Ras-group-related LRR protein 6 n=1 Tax=Elaeis guineensis var. tenera TaxID=51953 RepID=A0A6I9S0B5_ELAGV|nr:plant intracellular Ras-group-related LRR protein 6 [Elaeis guineensis]